VATGEAVVGRGRNQQYTVLKECSGKKKRCSMAADPATGEGNDKKKTHRTHRNARKAFQRGKGGGNKLVFHRKGGGPREGGIGRLLVLGPVTASDRKKKLKKKGGGGGSGGGEKKGLEKSRWGKGGALSN